VYDALEHEPDGLPELNGARAKSSLSRHLRDRLIRISQRRQFSWDLRTGCSEFTMPSTSEVTSVTEQDLLQSPDWYKALTLRERIAALRSSLGHIDQEATPDKTAERRLKQWRAQPSFRNNQSLFAQRLASDGITEPELLHILGDSSFAVRDGPAVPEWWTEIRQPFSALATSQPLTFPKSDGDELLGLIYVVEPLLHRAIDRVRRGAEELKVRFANCPMQADSVADILFPILAGRLLGMLSRTAALELNVARLEGVLEGDTPEDRFRSFVRRLSQRENRLAFLQEYPVLARQLINCIDLWSAFSLELLEHLCADWPQILSALHPDASPGVLVEVEGSGDTHNRGRCVLILKFSSGFRLVYKPRTLSLDVHFETFLHWINEHVKDMQFRTPKTLNFEDHGWVEFVAAAPCASQEEVRRFYRRLGGYLALLYALQAVDFHRENLIAAGEHPILIDLEALFHATPQDIAAAEFDDPASYALASSVLRVGLLPGRFWGDAQRQGIDISGFGGQAGQLTPFGVPQWEKSATDEMQLTRKPIPIKASQNRPSLANEELDPRDYVEEITNGFTEIYRFVLNHRDQLLSSDGPLACFADDKVRVILRPTRTYAVLLGESFHPDMLRDALDREPLFDRLWVAVEEQPYLAQAIPAERDDLQRADIPIFSAGVTSHDLLTSSNARLVNFLSRSGLELVHGQLRLLSEENLSRQLWMIRASMATLGRDSKPQTAPARSAQVLARPERDQFVSAARAIGDRLSHLALRSTEIANWLGLVQEESGQDSILPLGLDLYDGLPGVALYLAYLGDIAADESYTVLAKSACATFVREVEKNRESILWIGGMEGWGGIIYALTHLSVLWEDPTLLKRATEFSEQIPPLIEHDDRLDIVAGAAGCIASLLALNQCSPSPRILDIATQAGEHLLQHAQTMDRGVGWIIPGFPPRPLPGFAHGCAGIAWALLRLAASTGETRFHTMALAATEHERTLWIAEAGNGQNQRSVDSVGASFPTSWCHGAAGVGLARLDTLAVHDTAQVRSEIDAAVRIVLARGFGFDHSLCHGDMGLVELLLYTRALLEHSDSDAQLEQAAGSVLADIYEHGWHCGTAQAIETPGLMTGLSGIGYGLLRVAEPLRVPSVLLLMPPQHTWAISAKPGS
jgi:type 2 lantibiotic biosynthesis protein LanM